MSKLIQRPGHGDMLRAWVYYKAQLLLVGWLVGWSVGWSVCRSLIARSTQLMAMDLVHQNLDGLKT